MDYEIKKVGRIVADGIDMDTAKVVFANGLKLDVTFDRLQNNLIIHRWYKLDEEQHERVRTELSKYFMGLVGRGESAA